MSIQLTRKRLTIWVFLTVVLSMIIFLTGCSSKKTSNLSSTETPEQFKLKCTKLDYTQLARNPDNYQGQRIVYVGKVVQTQESGNDMVLRINVTKGESGLWKDTVWVNYTKPVGSNRILEDDVVQLWGTVKGLRHYTAVMGNEVTIPEIDAKYIEVYNGQTSSSVSSTTNADGAIKKAQNLLSNKNIQGTVVATSLGNNPSGFLSLVKNNNQYSFVIYDNANQQIAGVPFSQETYNFLANKNQKNVPPLIFNMTIHNDNHDRDEKNGVWNGENHMIPIYALYKFDQNGNVVPGMLNTGWGAKPSHYQGYLNEQKNVDIANLFLLEMKALQDNANSNQVLIP